MFGLKKCSNSKSSNRKKAGIKKFKKPNQKSQKTNKTRKDRSKQTDYYRKWTGPEVPVPCAERHIAPALSGG
jgi:hypothetical protein